MIDLVIKEPFARTLFGKAEINIIKKQVKGIKLTQSEKNRLSRDIRPKFKAIKEFSNYEDEFELKHNQNKIFFQKRIIQLVKEHPLFPKVKAIILFGSHANNTQNLFSDMDFAVILDNATRKESFEFEITILGDLPDKIDFHVFNELPTKVKKTIRENHKVIFKKSTFNKSDLNE